jgi:hypothetical protein
MKINPVNPCRSCALVESDKNNRTCLKCGKRVAYVACLDRDLNFPAGRPETRFAAYRHSLVSRQARLLTASPELCYE